MTCSKIEKFRGLNNNLKFANISLSPADHKSRQQDGCEAFGLNKAGASTDRKENWFTEGWRWVGKKKSNNKMDTVTFLTSANKKQNSKCQRHTKKRRWWREGQRARQATGHTRAEDGISLHVTGKQRGPWWTSEE